jgi:pimeloyl-ACP methyl ester carboxylesterase
MTNIPRLLFLPGAGADPGFWRPAGDLLPTHWRKTYFGWPGLGDQPAAPDVNSLEDLVRLVEAELGDEPVDLLAQSMGGLIAMMLVLRHPLKIRRLVLSVTSAGAPMARLGAAEWRERYHRNYPNAAPWVRDVHADLSDQLWRVTQPVLLLWGDVDPISPVSVGEHLRDLFPNARLHVVRGGDHDIARDRADEAASLIKRHLEDMVHD